MMLKWWNTNLEMAFGIEKQILGFDIPVSDTLAVKVCETLQHLLEAALDFGGAHTTVTAIIRASVTIRYVYRKRGNRGLAAK